MSNSIYLYNTVPRSNRLLQYDTSSNSYTTYDIQGVQVFYEYSSISIISDNSLCISGGVKNAIPTHEYFIVNVYTSSLKSEGELIQARSEHFSIYYNNRIYHFFGESSEGTCEYTDLSTNRQYLFYQNSDFGQSVGSLLNNKFYISSAFLDTYLEYDPYKERIIHHRYSLPSPQEVVTMTCYSSDLIILHHEYVTHLNTANNSLNTYDLNIKGCRWCPMSGVYNEGNLFFMDFRSKTYRLKLSALVS
jgi:hypothetical protein